MNDFARAVLGKPVVPLYQNGHNQKVAKCVKASLSLTLLHFFCAYSRITLVLPPTWFLFDLPLPSSSSCRDNVVSRGT